MKNIIYNNYNILVDEINKNEKNYYFYYNDELFLFYYSLNTEENIKEIYKYIKEYNIDCFQIINTVNGMIYTNVNDEKYILLRVQGVLKYEYTFEDFKYYPINKDGLNWGELWSKRLDYYEIQIRELGFKYQTVLNTYGLFCGLAENAILYFNKSIKTFKDITNVGIVHNRMNYPCYLLDYNNPATYVIDYSIRDIAEYIKSYLFSEQYNIDYVIYILNKLNLNSLMFNLLYSRLLYPTFYFDIFDEIILGDGKDSDVIPIIEVIEKYFNMLKTIYYNFNKKYLLFKIEWLDKIKM